MTWLRANTEGKIIFRPQANKKQDRSNNAQETLNDISVLTIESDVTIVLNCRKLMISLAGKHEKNFHDRLWAVGYVGGTYLLSIDADNYTFVLCLMTTNVLSAVGTVSKVL